MTTILVIDDDPYTEMIVTAAVPDTWAVQWAPNGLVGLDLLRGQPHTRTDVDLVILDITMPGLDGYDTCVCIRQIAPTMRILPFTGVEASPEITAYLSDLHCAPLLRKGCCKLQSRIPHDSSLKIGTRWVSYEQREQPCSAYGARARHLSSARRDRTKDAELYGSLDDLSPPSERLDQCGDCRLSRPSPRHNRPRAA